MMTTKKWIGALLCAYCLPFLATAQEFEPERAFDDLKSLKGVWFMPTDRGDRLEIWTVENDSTMSGRSVRIKPEDGDTVLLETLRLTRRDTLVTYTVTVRNQNGNKPIDFKLTEAYADEFLFENPKHDDPQKIRYVLLGNREMQVTTEGKKNNRTVSHDYVFEREFAPTTTEFRVRAGLSGASLMKERDFNGSIEGPDFNARPGWEIGVGSVFKGRGGFLSMNAEIGLVGRYSTVKASFYEDTLPGTLPLQYVRDGSYRMVWFNAALCPEFTFKRDGRFSLLVGPYYGRLIANKLVGTSTPASKNKLFNSNTDIKKNDFGLMAGAQYRLNLTKKDLEGKIGLRFNMGLTDVDQLYKRRCPPGSTLCNERVLLRSASLYYSVNLVKL